MNVTLYRQDPHLQVQGPQVLGNNLCPGGQLERFVISLTVNFYLRKVQERAGLPAPVGESSVRIACLLETLFRDVPIKLICFDVSIEEQAIGFEGLQLELGSQDQDLFTESLRLLQIPNLEINSSQAHESVRKTSRFICLDLFYFPAVANFFLKIIDGDLVVAEAET